MSDWIDLASTVRLLAYGMTSNGRSRPLLLSLWTWTGFHRLERSTRKFQYLLPRPIFTVGANIPPSAGRSVWPLSSLPACHPALSPRTSSQGVRGRRRPVAGRAMSRTKVGAGQACPAVVRRVGVRISKGMINKNVPSPRCHTTIRVWCQLCFCSSIQAADAT